MSKPERNTLEYLFGSKLKVKILKFYFRNFPTNFGVHTLSHRIQEPLELVQKEVKLLQEVKLLVKKN